MGSALGCDAQQHCCTKANGESQDHAEANVPNNSWEPAAIDEFHASFEARMSAVKNRITEEGACTAYEDTSFWGVRERNSDTFDSVEVTRACSTVPPRSSCATSQPPDRCIWESLAESQAMSVISSALDNNPLSVISNLSPVVLPDTISTQLRAFQELRNAEASRAYHAVFSVGLFLLAIGVGIRVVITMLDDGNKFPMEVMWLKLFESLLLTLGLVLCSTCPLQNLILDMFFFTKPIIRIAFFGICTIGLSFIMLGYPPYLHALPSFFSLVGCVRWKTGCAKFFVPRSTTLLVCTFISWLIAWGASYLYEGTTEKNVAGALYLVGAVAASGLCVIAFRQQRESMGTDAAWTSATYVVLYSWFVSEGIDRCLAGCFLFVLEPVMGALKFTNGFSFFLPVLLVIGFGRKRLFGWSARILDRNLGRSQRDGAFVAALLDAAVVERGQVWWEHRPDGAKNALYDMSDMRYNWRRGRVVRKRKNVIHVAFDAEQFVGVSSELGLSTSHHSSISSLKTGSVRPDGSISSTVSQRASFESDMSISNFSATSVSSGLQLLVQTVRRTAGKIIRSPRPTLWLTSEVKCISIPEGEKSSQEIIENARGNLRCMDWDQITWELMASGAICSVTDMALQRNEYYALSRSVRSGERIDFFISHSWSDDADAKWAALKRIASEFQQRHSRQPTFWLDKTCINQANLADGLRTLPVCVMSCTYLLVLHGPSYCTRMWCIWEVFVLMAFTQLEGIAKRMVVVPIGSAQDINETFGRFDIRNAHCYDPNEERRLLQVIDAVGIDDFNARVQQLVKVITVPNQRQSRVSEALRKSFASVFAGVRSTTDSYSDHPMVGTLVGRSTSSFGTVGSSVQSMVSSTLDKLRSFTPKRR